MTVNPDSDNWGLLSVADLLHTDFESSKKAKYEASWIMSELVFPTYCGHSSKTAAAFAKQLSTSLAKEGNSRGGKIEELFQHLSKKMQHSLATSRVIQQRLKSIIEFLTSSIPVPSAGNSGFESVSLLVSAMENTGDESFVDMFISSVKMIHWSNASPISCLEILKVLHQHVDDSQCSESKISLLNSWKMTLALHSGRLSAVVRCILLPDSRKLLKGGYKPPVQCDKVDVGESSIDSFFVRKYKFPFCIEGKKLSCFPKKSSMYITSGSQLIHMESLGMMGTRLQKTNEYSLPLYNGETILSIDENTVLVTKLKRVEDCRFVQFFRELKMTTGEECRQGSIEINCSKIGTRNTHVYFTVFENEVLCLVSNISPNIAKRKLYTLPPLGLREIFSQNSSEVFLDPRSHVLLRKPARLGKSHALHFTRGSSISVGRVTLKENVSPFCIELWVYPRNSTETQTILSIGKKKEQEILIEIAPNGDGIEWRGGWRRTLYLDASTTSFCSPGKLAFFERWWHVALNFTGTSWELWLDDHFVAHSPALMPPEPIRNETINLGKSFVGFLAEVRVWGATRNATELHRDAHRSISDSDGSLLSYFPLDEGYGDLLTDHSLCGEHALLNDHAATWYNVPYIPVVREDEKRIHDFLPLGQWDEENSIFFAATPHHISLASCCFRRRAVTLFQYGRTTRVLVSQMLIELEGRYHLKGIAYNATKDSLMCWASTKESNQQMTFWDVHNQNFLAFSTDTVYSSIWECGKDVISHTAKYALKFLSAERYLADQSSWTTKLPDFLMDSSEDSIPLLIAFINKVSEEKQDELTKDACLVLHANLFMRHEVNVLKLCQEVGQPFGSATELLDVLTNGKTSCPRDQIIRIAFIPSCEESALPSICCRCFLSIKAQIFFLNAACGKVRPEAEEKLFLALLENYSTLQVCSEALEEVERAQILYCALIREAAFQVDRCLTEKGPKVLQKTSRCLEVFQELLFARVTDPSSTTTELTNLSVHYTKTLLRASDKTIEAVLKALRKCPQAENPLIECLERSHVGSLLPSFSLSLPALPPSVVVSFPNDVQSCRESLSALMSTITAKARWISSLGVALTFSLSSIGCSLLQSDQDVGQRPVADEKYLPLLRGGKRKAGSERDVLIKNLQQGVGAIGKVFEELQKKDHTALRVVRDLNLKRMERNVMAAFCALMIPTKDMKEPSAESLQPAFHYVLQMRPWVLSKRQESKEYVGQVEARAVFLSQFESCCKGGADVTATRPQAKPKEAPSRKWKRFFRNWKALRYQKMLVSSQEDTDQAGVSKSIMEFLQSDINSQEPEELIGQRTKKAQVRLSGLILMKQLTEEARVSPALASIVLPTFAKACSAWHYADDVDCSSNEKLSRLHSAYFQFFDLVLDKYLEESDPFRRPWGVLLCSLFSSDMRPLDFRHMRPEICPAFRALWSSSTQKEGYCRRPNSILSSSLRETRLTYDSAAPSITVGESGLTIRSQGGSGTCMAPCIWKASDKQQTYYFEICVVDLLSGSSCSVGLGPRDYNLSHLPGWREGLPSFAFQSGKGVLLPNGNTITGFTFSMGDVVGCGWDLFTQEVYWTRNGVLLLSTEANQEELCPLIGFSGTGLVKLNFGEELFFYSESLYKNFSSVPLNIRNDAWDAFRAFSIRAALCLRRSTSMEGVSDDSIKQLASCIEYCFNALTQELTEALLETHLNCDVLQSVFSHTSTLSQLLHTVPKDWIASRVQRMSLALESAATIFLTSPSATPETLCRLLTAWFNCMNLSPPDSNLQPEGTNLIELLSKNPNSFLGTLLRLAGRLFTAPKDVKTENVFFSALSVLRHRAEEVSSMALGLLQRVNGYLPAGSSSLRDAGPELSEVKATLPHAWEQTLHEWLLQTLRTGGPGVSTEVMTALAIMAGSPRYAVPGDEVIIFHSTHVTTTGVLISYSIHDEWCEVVDGDGMCKILPLRLCGLIIPENETSYFPIAGCPSHEEQAKEVMALASRLWQRGRVEEGEESLTLCNPLLLSIIWRSAVRGVIQLPKSVLAYLYNLCGELAVEPSVLESDALRTEKVITDWRCAAALQVIYDHEQLGMLGPNETSFTGKTLLLCTAAKSDATAEETSELIGEEAERADTPLDDLELNQFSVTDNMLNGMETEDEERFLNEAMNELMNHEREMEEELEEEELEEEELEEEGESSDSDGINMEYMEDMDMEPSASDEREDGADDSFSQGKQDYDEASDSIHFEKGCLRVASPHAVGNKFTVEILIRAVEFHSHQILLLQEIGATEAKLNLLLVSRLMDSRVEFGVVECVGVGINEPSDEWLCKAALLPDDAGRFLRLTFVQLGSTLSLYIDGVLKDTKKVPFSGSLLQKELSFGGTPENYSFAFVGDMKGILIYEIALEPNMVGQLHSLNSSFAMLVDSRLCVKLRVMRKRFQNACKSSAAIPLDVTPHGDVGYLESSTEVRNEVKLCAQELDFSYDTEEKDPHTIGSLHAISQNSNTSLAMRKKEGLSSAVLFLTRKKICRALTEFYGTTIICEALYRSQAFSKIPKNVRLRNADKVTRPDLDHTAHPSLLEEATSLKEMASDSEKIKRLICYAVFSGCDHLCTLLNYALQKVALCVSTEASSALPSDTETLGNESLRHLLRVAQREQQVRVYESNHPYRPSTRSTHGVMMAGQRYYQLYFDPRCASSYTYFTFSSDQSLSNELAQLPGFALSPFAVPLPRIFFNVHSDSTEPQWGYKVFVVFDCRPQLLAMRLFRTMLTTFLERCGSDHLSKLPFLTTPECLQQLGNCAKVNTGKTRRLALSCLTDLLLHAEHFPVCPPPFCGIHEIRRMTERRYKKHLSHQMVHSRFLQVVSECYLTYKDAQYCWTKQKVEVDMEKGKDPKEEFFLQRQQQRSMYAEREGEERVKVYKMQEPQTLQVEWNSERICVTRSDASGGAIIAATPLTKGVWYYEMRVGGAGEVYVGVLPTRVDPNATAVQRYGEGLLERRLQPIAYNGRGVCYGKRTERLPGSGARSAWRFRDYVGIVLSLPDKMCTILVNGEASDLQFSFGNVKEEDGSDAEQVDTLSYCPYFAFESTETFFFNFGGANFEFEPPRGCLPLDPINFMLGTVIPYNQLRAFHDLSAHLLTAGRHPMPPFYYEEPDPFANSTERTGPAHVSLNAVEGAQVNGLDVINIGSQFCTVIADCTVSGGAWYYEVTLRSQGLMQIGWSVKSELHDGSIGDMPSSWSIDLFRQLKWYNGKSDPVTVPRRWNVGDVIGCALDLNAREMNFYFNGRKIFSGGATFRCLPVGVAYTPGISLRAGNHVTFNFGSSVFQYKPDGFQALGVRDSWCERIDTYYANESVAAALRRQRVQRDLWREGFQCHDTLQTCVMIVKAVDAYCQESCKSYTQITEEILRDYLERQGCTSSTVLEGCWKQFSILNALARLCLVVIPFLCLSTHQCTVTTNIFLLLRTVLFRNVRGSLVIAMLRETNVKIEQRTLYVNRRRARDHQGNPKNTMFGQTLSLIEDRHPRMFQTDAKRKMWSTVFLGEGAEDVGGPYREHISTMCRELMSSALPFFVPTANNALNTGTYRECFVPAAGATSTYDLASFLFVGRLMGYAMRAEEPLSLYFPPLVWRYLCHFPITEEDIMDIDSICMQCISEFRSIEKNTESAADFDDIFDAEFVTRLSDNSLKELIPGGAHIKVTLDRCNEYASLLLEARIHEFDVQLHHMREGLLSVVPDVSVLLFTPAELELKVCGKSDYNVEEIRKTATYESCTAEQRRVQYLWKALEEATPEQRRLFLRFVCGRDRLPVKIQISALSTVGDPDERLPQASTCFFTIKLPDYSSLEVMKQKLYYSIESCVDMDNDFTTAMIDESEGPRMVVHMDEGHEDGTATQEE